MDVMHYTIERDFAYDTKSLHYLNCFVSNDAADEPDFEFMNEGERTAWLNDKDGLVDIIDFTFLFIPLAEVPVIARNHEELSMRESSVKQYIARLPESMAQELNENYYGEGKPGTYLPIERVTNDTPCGEYWCNR